MSLNFHICLLTVCRQNLSVILWTCTFFLVWKLLIINHVHSCFMLSFIVLHWDAFVTNNYCLMFVSSICLIWSAVDPGVVETNIMREVPSCLSHVALTVLKLLGLLQSPEQGISAILDAALAPPVSFTFTIVHFFIYWLLKKMLPLMYILYDFIKAFVPTIST